MLLNINADNLVKFTHALEKMGKSQLPYAVKTALNSAAFDVKKNTMPAAAKSSFIQRKPTFFQGNSKVVPAKGTDIKNMEAVVGFIPKSGNDKSVDDLEQQEHGGEIGGRAFIPLIGARTSNSWSKNVRGNVRISDIKKQVVDANDATGSNDKEKFIKSAIHAGKGGFVLGTGKNAEGNRSLLQIRSIIRKGKNTIVKSVPLFAVKGGRRVTPKASHFMKTASLESAQKIEQHFIDAAKKIIK